ncbi:MAG: DUF4298 domain-containing protein [Butyrivibrio sp.]|nr:DUF4298 domain-containing protein [Butyrivibrio sp.]
MVCANCPNKEDKSCATLDKVLAYDEANSYEGADLGVGSTTANHGAGAGAASAELEADVRRFAEYYDGPDWKADFALDEAGLLPGDLKRGVLSEDGIYDALKKYKEIF